MHKSWQVRRARRVVAWAAAALFSSALVLGCNRNETAGRAATTSAPSAEAHASQLPAPYGSLRIGLAWEKVSASYPPAEDVSTCALELVGGDTPMPPLGAGDEEKARSFCARAIDVAGTTDAEGERLVALAAQADGDAMLVSKALFYSAAQLRGSVRAGQIDDAEVLAAASGSETAHEAFLRAVGKLHDGSVRFAAAQSSRRPIAACVHADCSGLNAKRVRTYVSGSMTLAEMDAEAKRRVDSGKCRADYTKNEKRFQRNFVAATGALAAIGLARASQADAKLDPDNPASFAVHASRSKVDAETARLGIRIANGLAKTEAFWRGAVALDSGHTGQAAFGRAIVWIEEQKIARVLVNVDDEQQAVRLVDELGKLYGKPAMQDETMVRWTLESGRTATLRLGVALSLVVE